MNVRRSVAVIVLVLVVLVLGWAILRWTHPVSTATLQMHCSALPDNDTALGQWLTSQPLVLRSAVTRQEGNVTITYKRNAADAGEFATAVMEESKRRGYGVNGYSLSYNKNPFQ